MKKKRWIFCFNNKTNDNINNTLLSEINLFLSSWKAHGKALTSYAKIHQQQVLEIVVDESEISASGCSIDNMSKNIKEICKSKQVEFLDESCVPIMIDNCFIEVKRSNLKTELQKQTILPESLMIDFSGLVVISDGTEDFIKEIKNSWVKSYL